MTTQRDYSSLLISIPFLTHPSSTSLSILFIFYYYYYFFASSKRLQQSEPSQFSSKSEPKQTPLHPLQRPSPSSASSTLKYDSNPLQKKNNTAPNFIGMSGGQIFHEMMLRHGVKKVFGYPGGAILPVFDAIYNSPHFDFILPRHEQGAGHMAEGYARARYRNLFFFLINPFFS